MYTKEGVFSWNRRTVASSSDCNFLGEVTTEAEAEPISARKKEKDRATEMQRRRRESSLGEEVMIGEERMLAFPEKAERKRKRVRQLGMKLSWRRPTDLGT